MLRSVDNVRLSLAVLAVLTMLSFVPSSSACSMAGCLNNGDEMRSTFTIQVRHDGKPLAGVNFHILSAGKERFSAITDETGVVQVARLTPGDYWLNGDLLRTVVVYTCFHISAKPSRKAKSKLAYAWGDEAPATTRIAGELVDIHFGTGGSPILNITRRTEVLVVGAGLKLQDPFTHATYVASSDQQGRFAFEAIPNGIYVLHVDGGAADERSYDSTDEVIRLSSNANYDWLHFSRRDPGGGSCGGTEMELKQMTMVK